MKIFGSRRRIVFDAIFVALFIIGAWFFLVRMPGKNVMRAAVLTSSEISLRNELKADVEKLAGEIGERNMIHYLQLNAAADFIENSFSQAGLRPSRDTYEIDGHACHNIDVENPGTRSEIVLVGAHYDSVFGATGANDNGSGVAAVLALARRFARKHPDRTLRFVAFVNEEPPFFQTPQMGSFVYAKRCKDRGDKISAMISLETIGYFSDESGSQIYPVPGLGLFYPRVGNFIAFVGNVGSRSLVRRTISSFRAQNKIPSEGAAVPSFIPGISWSDQWSFWQHGYPAIMVTDTALFRYSHYHKMSDTPDKLDYDRFALVVSGLEQVISDLATAR